MQQLIDTLSAGVPGALTEVISLGRTLNRRAEDVLAYFHDYTLDCDAPLKWVGYEVGMADAPA